MRTIGYALAFLAGITGCSRAGSSPSATEASTPIIASPTEARERDPENLPDVTWPRAPMPPGKAWLKCDWSEKAPTQITEMSAQVLLPLMLDCWHDGKVTNFELTYKGEIGKGFTDLIARMNELARRFEVTTLSLSMDSGGGDVMEAISAGNLLAKANWRVSVPNDANCYSACVLVLAAGSVRAIGGNVGIHRIIPVNSSAKSRDQLNDELNGVHDQVTTYLAKNGVAKTVSDLMMTVPAGDIRILTREELKNFGLWWTNAAQADLARLALIQKCGKDYVTRRDTFIQSATQCQNGERSEAGFAAYSKCMDALADELGLPDSKCPESPSAIMLERGPSG